MSIPGLEARHQWNGGVILNRRLDDTGGLLLPRYKCDRITGLASLGDSEDVRDLMVGHQGERPRHSLRRGKTVVYEGWTQAGTLADLRDAETALRAGFEDQWEEKQMVITPHPLVGGESRYFMARALGLEIGDQQGSPHNFTYGYQRPFIVSVRLSDARVYDVTEHTDSVTVLTGEGEASIPITVVNGGTTATDPVFEVSSGGPGIGAKDAVAAAGPVLVNGIPVAMSLAGNVITASEVGQATVDGRALELGEEGERFLHYSHEVADVKYGIFRVTQLGNDFQPFKATRTADADSGAELPSGTIVPVYAGAINRGQIFELVTPDPITPNVTPLQFSRAAPSVTLTFYLVSETGVQARLIIRDVVLDGSVDLGNLIVDFKRRTAHYTSGALVTVAPESTWWDENMGGFYPGDNSFSVAAVHEGVTPYEITVDITWHDAFS